MEARARSSQGSHVHDRYGSHKTQVDHRPVRLCVTVKNNKKKIVTLDFRIILDFFILILAVRGRILGLPISTRESGVILACWAFPASIGPHLLGPASRPKNYNCVGHNFRNGLLGPSPSSTWGSLAHTTAGQQVEFLLPVFTHVTRIQAFPKEAQREAIPRIIVRSSLPVRYVVVWSITRQK